MLTKINFMIENKEPEELTDILQAIIEVVKSLQPDLQVIKLFIYFLFLFLSIRFFKYLN